MKYTHIKKQLGRKLKLSASLCLLVAVALSLTAGSRAKTRTRVDATAARAVNNTPAVLDLKDFGATGDGVTDDGPALQSALDALAEAGGGTLHVSAGRYAIATPVSKSFKGLDASITISGVPSDVQVAPPDAEPFDLAHGLELASEFLPKTGSTGGALALTDLRAATVKDVAFVGTAGVETDARYTLALFDVDDASVMHSEFYGLSSSVYGSDLLAVRSRLRIERSVFLGCTANSASYTSVVQNLEWKDFEIEEAIFLDYGLRPELFSKTGIAAPQSWVQLGNAAALTNDSPRREAIFRSVFMDEGGLSGISALPERYTQPPSAPIDLVYIDGLKMNVSNLGTSGNYISRPRAVLIEDSSYGWSHNADCAVNLLGVGHAILDRVVTEASATRLRADAETARFTVIDSIYTDLASLSPQTFVINTNGPDEDPVQFVRERFKTALGREPDPAAHFYWSDRILRCGADTQCDSDARAALDAYLAASPSETFEIEGLVTDENNSPLAGVSVVLTGSQSVSTTTDAEGLYHFSNLPTSGVYSVGVSKRHYTFGTPSQTFTTPTGEVRADFNATLMRHALSGRVTDDAGHALAGASLALSGSLAGTTTSDANGNYVFEGLAAGGAYSVAVSKTNYTFAPASASFADLSNDVLANFRGTPTVRSIFGRVTDINNTGMSGATVKLSGSSTATTTTAGDGSYRFDGLPVGGNYTVKPSLFSQIFSPVSQSFDNLNADHYAGFVGRYFEYKIKGRVTKSDGTAVAGVNVTLTGSRTATATTDSNGSYTLSAPASGDYTVRPSKTDYTFGPASRTLASLDSDQTADFNATPGTHAIRGRVTGAGGAALAGASVTLSGSRSATTTSDSSGNYSFTQLPSDGTYTLTVSKANYTFTPPAQTFAQPITDKTADFSGALVNYRIAGRVTSGASGLAGVTVALSGSQSATTNTGADGSYSFTVLAEGNYTVTPAKAHYTFAPPAQTFNNLSSDKTADFAATLLHHTISGRVTKTDGSALAGVAVALTGSQVSNATTDAQGNFSFANLAAGGDYTITTTLRHYTFAPVSKEFRDLGSDQSAPFVATLDTHTISGRVLKADNSPLAGASVTLAGSKTATTTTDASGRYAFDNLGGGGSYTVNVSKAHYTFAPQGRAFEDLSSNQTADFAAALVNYRIGGRVTENKSPLEGVTVTLTGSQVSTATTAADGSYSFTVPAEGTYILTAAKARYILSPQSLSIESLDGDKTADFNASPKELIEFGTAALSVGEGGGTLEVTVTRTGDTSEEVSAVYEVESGTALRGSDVVGSAGRITFAPGETTKTFTLFITDDTHVEGSEQFSIQLMPEGEAFAGALSSVSVTIDDNDTDPTAPNAIDDTEFFVRQHYRDFLGREPDAAGLAFWKEQINSCGADAGCRDVKRINVSAAFFLSIEFQETGFFVYKTYRAAFGRAPERLGEFTLDSHDVSAAVVVGEEGWQQKLEHNKEGYVADFVGRDEFEEAHPVALTPAQFVSELDANTGNSLTTAERDAAVAEFGGAQDTSNLTARARVLRRVVDNAAFHKRETNPAFVLMQYFGYLRREPDQSGFGFWLKKLEDFGGDFRRAEMVKAFLASDEYRHRFGR